MLCRPGKSKLGTFHLWGLGLVNSKEPFGKTAILPRAHLCGQPRRIYTAAQNTECQAVTLWIPICIVFNWIQPGIELKSFSNRPFIQSNGKLSCVSNRSIFRKSRKKDRKLSGQKYTWKSEFKFRNEQEIKRKVAALQTDHSAGNPFYLYLRHSGGPVSSLRFWQDVEKCRLDYEFGSMDFSAFSESVSYDVHSCFILDHHNNNE